MSDDLVSVIIPAYKCEEVISSALESVLGQTYRNVEVIVVDDGSPDNLEGAVERYRDRIRYISQENGGVSKARNTGVRASLGKFVAFLDADDAWDREKLALQVEILSRHPEIGMLFSAFHFMRGGNVLKDRNYRSGFNFFREYRYDIRDIFPNRSTLEKNGVRVEYHWGDIYDRLFLGNFILPSSVIARKESFLACGGFNERIRVAEETDFFLRFSARRQVGFLDHPVVYYEIPSQGNLSGKSNMETLIKNAYKIQTDSFIENQNFLKRGRNYYLKAISNTYCRLAYYYLSELKTGLCREYARHAMKICRTNTRPYYLYAMGALPSGVLKQAGNLKRAVKA